MKHTRTLGISALLVLTPSIPVLSQGEITLNSQGLQALASETLDKAIQFFRTLSIQGGYVHFYDLQTGERWGEERTDKQTIEVQPPGTPSVGAAFLRAFGVTGNRHYLEAAEEAASALVAGQNELGGWEHTIHFDRPKGHRVSFDDNQTQSAIRFLMTLDQESDEPFLRGAIERALQMMLDSQFENGAWPHRYPKQGDYHDFATFNDGGINDCVAVMIDAHKFYGKTEYLESVQLAGNFILLSQLPPPQPGWAQQYNQYLQPAWARSFEPPSVCPLVTLRNVATLFDLASHTKDMRYLEPIRDALAWIAEVRLPSGFWPRFVELGTNRPLYYDRGRLRVNSIAELQAERRNGYGYEQDLSPMLKQQTERLSAIKQTLSEGSFPSKTHQETVQAEESLIRKIISEQDSDGKWISRDNRISSRVFVDHVNALCDYLEQVGWPPRTKEE